MEFKGIPNYPGEVKGTLVKDIENIDKVKNPVLYVEDFLIEDTLYIRKLKGLIIKRRLLLCHAAILAREFEVPSLVGVDMDDVPEGTKIILKVPREFSKDGKIVLGKVIVSSD